MRKPRVLVLLIALILALAAPPALAREGDAPAQSPPAAKAETFTRVLGAPVAVPRSNVHVFYEARATCPAGQTPTGGGPKVSPYYNPLPVISSYASGPTWVVTVDGESDVDATLWASVICSTAPHTQVFNGPITVGARTQGSLPALCPPGQYATGGGGRVDLGVICSQSPHHHYWGDGTKLPLFHGTAHDLKACPSGTVTGGGALAVDTAIYESSFWENGWLAQAVNESAGHPEVRANVVCKD
ncbi:hypothetical protein [Streptomyces sp. NPDC094032]|uniref:hypothetical protein n=1 Tax=Streptomyces sp. NPDC094032 TaxID=3155308 RepID=UPI0033324EAD